MSARNRNNAERRPDPIESLDTAHKTEAGKADRAAKVEGGDLEKANELVMQAQAKAAEALAELALIRGGQVGAEKVKLTSVEDKKAGELEKKVEEAEEKVEYAVDKTRVKKLEGSVDEQLKTLDKMWKEMDAGMKNTSSADLGLYKKLYKKGSTQDEFGKYSKISAKEQSRLSAIEGPVITSDVIKKMASGEMSWTMNGIYAAMNELRAGRLPATGSRPEAAPAGASIHEFPTGKTITGAEAVAAALAAAALLESGETHEAPRSIEAASSEYDAALQEQKGLFEERENLKTDARILIDINEIKDPVARMEAILKNMGKIAEYLQLFDASASVEEIQQMFPSMKPNEAESFKNFIEKMNEQDFNAKVIQPGLALSGAERILFIESALTNALAQSNRMIKKTSARDVELKTKIAALEKELAAAKRLTPEQVLAKETNEAEAKLMEVSGRIKNLDKELNEARRLPPSAENDFRLVELTRTMKELQAEKEKIRRRLDELKARGEKLAAEAAAKTAASETIEYSPADYAGGSNDEYVQSGAPAGESEPAVSAGKFERIEPVEVRPDSQLAADISESENQPSQNAKPTEKEPESRETETRETLKLAREILTVRKEAYAADIAAGNLSAAELRTIKEKLTDVGAEAAVEKVFTSSKTREFRIKPKFIKQLKPFASSLYDRLIADTDALIALAEKTEAPKPAAGDNAPPGPDEVNMDGVVVPDLAAEPKRDARAEKREAVAAVMAASREAIKTKANEATAMDPKGLETAYKEIDAPEGSKAVKKLLLDRGVLDASDVEKLSNDEIFALRNELAAVYLKEIGKRAAAKSGEKAEPKPALKSPEREAAEKIVESAKTKFAARIEEIAGENIRTVEKFYNRLVNARPEKAAEELTDILMNGDCLTEDERTKLTPADLKALRKEVINICFEKISKKETKKQPPKGGAGEPPAPGPKPVEPAPPAAAEASGEEKEPRQIALEQLEQYLIRVGDKGYETVTADRADDINAEIKRIKRFDRGEYRYHLEIIKLPGVDVALLNDDDLGRLRDIEIAKKMATWGKAKELLEKRNAETKTDVVPDHNVRQVEVATASAPEAPKPPKPPEKAPSGEKQRVIEELFSFFERFSARLREGVDQLQESEDLMVMMSMDDDELFREALDDKIGIDKKDIAGLTPEDIKELRATVKPELEKILDKAKKKLIKSINRKMNSKNIKPGVPQIGETDSRKYTAADVVKLNEYVESGKPDIAAIRTLLETVGTKNP